MPLILPYIGSVTLGPGVGEPYPWPEAIDQERIDQIYTESSSTVSGIRILVPLGSSVTYRDYEMAIARMLTSDVTTLKALKAQWPKVPFNFSPDGVGVFQGLFTQDGLRAVQWPSDNRHARAGNWDLVGWEVKIKLHVTSQS